MASTHHRSSAKARIACAHPIGDAHDRTPLPTSPTALRTNDTPITAPPSANAARDPLATCAATAATPANTRPAPKIDIPKANDPDTGSPYAIRATALPMATSASAIATPISAAANGAWRPTGAARISSARSDSSSVRVCRTVMNTHMSATPMIVQIALSFIMTAPVVGSSRPYPGPDWTINAELPRTRRP